jgi:inner membrane protein
MSQQWPARGIAASGLLFLVFGCDGVLNLVPLPYVVQAIPDTLAHVATALLLLLALGWQPPPPFLGAYVLGCVLIDVDHIPILIHFQPLVADAHRPYTHSLTTVVLLVLIGILANNRGRVLAIGAASGVAVHLARDLATGYVPLLWPFTHTDYSVPYGVYASALGLVALGAWFLFLVRRDACPAQIGR